MLLFNNTSGAGPSKKTPSSDDEEAESPDGKTSLKKKLKNKLNNAISFAKENLDEVELNRYETWKAIGRELTGNGDATSLRQALSNVKRIVKDNLEKNLDPGDLEKWNQFKRLVGIDEDEGGEDNVEESPSLPPGGENNKPEDDALPDRGGNKPDDVDDAPPDYSTATRRTTERPHNARSTTTAAPTDPRTDRTTKRPSRDKCNIRRYGSNGNKGGSGNRGRNGSRVRSRVNNRCRDRNSNRG